jgi:hypothetical protein
LHRLRPRGASSPIANSLAGEHHFCAKFLGQIRPARIHELNQRNLLRAPPTLQLLFTVDRFSNLIEALPINQPIAMIFARKTFDLSALVLLTRT